MDGRWAGTWVARFRPENHPSPLSFCNLLSAQISVDYVRPIKHIILLLKTGNSLTLHGGIGGCKEGDGWALSFTDTKAALRAKRWFVVTVASDQYEETNKNCFYMEDKCIF